MRERWLAFDGREFHLTEALFPLVIYDEMIDTNALASLIPTYFHGLRSILGESSTMPVAYSAVKAFCTDSSTLQLRWRPAWGHVVMVGSPPPPLWTYGGCGWA